MSVELSNTQNALMGSFGSTIEVLIQHPLITYKNALQANRKLNPCIKSIYKGVSINALTMGPLTAVQFAGYGYFYKFFDYLMHMFHLFVVFHIIVQRHFYF